MSWYKCAKCDALYESQECTCRKKEAHKRAISHNSRIIKSHFKIPKAWSGKRVKPKPQSDKQ